MASQPIDPVVQIGKLTMAYRQRLDSDAIYRLNSELEQIRSLAAIGSDIPLVPVQLHNVRRDFRWLGVNAHNWKWHDVLLDKVQQALRMLLKEDGCFRPGMKEEVEEGWHERWDEGRSALLLRDWAAILAVQDVGSFDRGAECHRSLLELAGGMLADGTKNIDGLVLKKLKGNGTQRLKYVYNALSREDGSKVLDPPSQYECHFWNESRPETGWYDQRSGRTYDERQVAWDKDYPEQREHWLIKLHAALLDFDLKQVRGLISVPILDSGRADDPWGRLVGIVHIFVTEANRSRFEANEQRAEFVHNLLRWTDRLPQVFRAIGRAEAAGASIDRSGSKNGLAAQHFLERLTCFHDWQHVIVEPLREHEGELECWGRSKGGWKRISRSDCDHEKKAGELVDLHALNHLLDLPWANPRDLAELGRLKFELELPAHTLLPTDDRRKAILEQYQHELLDVMRLVLPKVQRHRYALRTGAVAIMSRNMSHNLGSHVLSAVASHPAGEDVVEKRNDLLRYLQERMDFLAEISTDGSFLSVSMSLEGIVAAFNQQELVCRFISGTKFAGRPVEVCVDPTRVRKVFLAMPGGRNGCHALYVIFENVARNCAKHRPSGPADLSVDLKLSASVEGEMIRLRLWDNGSNAHIPDSDRRTPLERMRTVIERESVIELDGTLRPGGWGLREMQFAAAYLRGVPLEDIESGQSLPLLHVLGVDHHGKESEEGDANICVEIYVRVPRDVLIVDPGLSDALSDDQKQVLDRSGIRVVPEQAAAGADKSEFRYLAADSCPSGTAEWPVRMIPVNGLRTGVASNDPDAIREAAAAGWCKQVLDRHGATNWKCFGNRGIFSDLLWETSDYPRENSVAYVRHHHEIGCGNNAEIVDNLRFWESYQAYGDQCPFIEFAPEELHEFLRTEFLTAAVARIVVLDERVQEAMLQHPGYWKRNTTFGNRPADPFLTMPEALEKRRIYVPDRPALKEVPQWSEIEDYLTRMLNAGSIDFIVVHLGILERMVGRDQERLGWNVALGELMAWAQPNQLPGRRPDCEVVICSGRGVPKEVRDSGCRFVPVSAVERWTVHNGSKLNLYELLASSRRRTLGHG